MPNFSEAILFCLKEHDIQTPSARMVASDVNKWRSTHEMTQPYLLDVDATDEYVRHNIVPHPGICLLLITHRTQQLIWDAKRDLYVGVEEGTNDAAVGVKELNFEDAIGLEKLHHYGGGERVRGLQAPVHTEPMGHTRKQHRQEEGENVEEWQGQTYLRFHHGAHFGDGTKKGS